MVRIGYDDLEAMRPAVAALERSGWDIRYKVDDLTEVKEIYLESRLFDESEEYVRYVLWIDGRVERDYEVIDEELIELDRQIVAKVLRLSEA